MSGKLLEGAQARLVQPVVEGTITDIRYNKDAACLEYLLSYPDAAGELHTRWFLETELEAI